MRRLVIAVAAVAFTQAVCAAPPSAESIDTLLAITKSEKLLDNMLATIDQMTRQSVAAATKNEHLTPAQQQICDAKMAKYAQVIKEELSWSKMRSLYVQVYQESFTQEEIDGLIAFYRSPAGAAFVEKMPVVMQKSMTIMQSRLAPMMERMKAVTQEAVEEAKAAK
jgi:hypothetical protein